MIVKDGGGFEKTPTGLIPAVCSNVYDIGVQPVTYLGETKLLHQVIILWELNERITTGEYSGQRFVISKRYTASLGEKANLRKDLESWRGRAFTNDELEGFELDNVIGKNCNLNIVEVTKGAKSYRNVASVNPAIKGSEQMTPELDRTHCPDWIKKLMGTILPQEDVNPYHEESENDMPF